jgi:hypothetical protein
MILLFPLWLVPGAAIGYFLTRYGFNATSWVTVVAVVLPPLACVMVAHLRLMRWSCPSCGRCFHVCWWHGNVFARRCVHCGLPRWATKQEPIQTDLA